MKKYEIELSDLRFHARHGVFGQETKVGNEFSVTLKVVIPFDESISDDNLEATISYADLYSVVESEMKKPRKLLEAVAASIQEKICSKWGQIEGGSITICKSTPPMAGITGSAKISLIF